MTRPEQMILIRRLLSWAAVVLLGGGSALAETPRTDRLGDPLPPGAVARLGTIRLRHDNAVVALAFAPDGKTLASVGEYGVIRIWETATGRELHCFRRRQGTIAAANRVVGCLSSDPPTANFALAYAPNGKVLALAGEDRILFLDAATGEILDQIAGTDLPFAFAPDGKTLAATTQSGVEWWDVATGVRLRSLAVGETKVASLAYSPDGKTLAYLVSPNEEITLCDPATGKVVRKLCKLQEDASLDRLSIAYSPDGKKLLVSGEHHWRLLDAASGKELRRNDDAPFYAPPAYAPNGRLIAAMSVLDERRPWICDLTRNKRYELRGRGQAGIALVVAFSPDGKLLASGGTDGRVRLWDVAARKEVDLPAGGAAKEGEFILSRDGKILAAIDGCGRVRLRDTANGKLLHQWDAPLDVLYNLLALSPDGAQAVILKTNSNADSKNEQSVQVVDAVSGRRLWEPKVNGYFGYSSDGSLLAASDDDGNIDLWDAAKGRRLGTFAGQVSGITTGVFAPDGKTLVTASQDHTVRVWDVAGRRERYRLKGHGGGATVSHITFSADGKRLATGGNDSRICVWDARTGRRLHRWTIEIEEDNVTCLALSPDGKLLVANAGEGCFSLRDVETGKAGPPIEGHRGEVIFAAFQPDGRTLLTAGREGTALVWDVAALRRRQPQAAPVLPETIHLGSLRLRQRQGVGCAVYSPNGKILATASSERDAIHLWDAATGREIHRLAEGGWLDVQRMRFSPDGKVLAIVSSAFWEGIRFWDVASGASLGRAVQNRKGITAFAFTPDGSALAVATEDGVYLQDLDTGERLRTFEKAPKKADQLAFTADGKTLLAAGVEPAIMCVLDVATGKNRRRYEIKGTNLALASDGRTLIYRDEGKHLRVCAAADGEELWKTNESDLDYVISPDSKHLLTISPNEPFRLREMATGKEILRSAANAEFMETRLCLSPDNGTLVAAVGRGEQIELKDVASGRERRPAGGHHGGITCLDFAPKGRTLVSGSFDGTLLLWDAISGKELRVIQASKEYIKCVAFSRDGKTIASGDTCNSVRLWDTATGKELWRFEGPRPKIPWAGGVQSLVFSPDGRTLIAGSSEDMVYLWDAATHKLRRQFQGFSTEGTAIAVSPDGYLLASAGKDVLEQFCGNVIIRLWDVATGRKVQEGGPKHVLQLAPIAFSPDGKLLAGHRIDSRIGFWELASGKEMFHIDTLERIAGFSPDGRYLVTTDGTLWDMGTGKEVGRLNGCEQPISALAVSRDGRWIATGGADATILVQPMPRPARPKSLLTHEPCEGELQTLWTMLSAADPARAWPAMRTLVETPRRSVPFL